MAEFGRQISSESDSIFPLIKDGHYTYTVSSYHTPSEASRLCDCANERSQIRLPPVQEVHNNDREEMEDSFILLIDKSGDGLAHWLKVLRVDDDDIVLDEYVHIEKWEKLEDRKDFEVCSLDNKVYVMGGLNIRNSENITTLGDVDIYDPVESDWNQCSPLLVPRSRFASTIVRNRIYIAGGRKSDGRVTASCEIYNPITGQWTKMGLLPGPRVGLAIIGTERYTRDFVYVSGGVHAKQTKNNFWCYESFKWSELDDDYPHKIRRSLERHCMVIVDGVLYFIGGLSRQLEGGETKCVEAKVDAFTHQITLADRRRRADIICPWNLTLPSLNVGRHSAAAVVLGDNIMVLGGKSTKSDPVIDIEVFNVHKKIWKTLFKLPENGEYGNVDAVLLNTRPKFEFESPPPTPKPQESKLAKWIMW